MNDMPRRALPPPEDPPPEPDRGRPHRAGPFGVLDIGTTKVACLIARIDSDGKPRVLGCGWQKGRGVNGGGINDLEKAERAIRACVGQAEDMADTRLQKVIVNLSCGQPESRLYNVQWPVGGRAVSDEDIRGVVHEGRTRALIEGRQSIHAIPLQFSADATDRGTDPRGLFCSTLGARLHIVDAAATALRSLEACIARCDLEIEELVSAPMAAGLSTLVPDERELGATVIDMGGGCTSIAVFLEGHLVYADVVPLGGYSVTHDISRGLAAPLSGAERVKTLFGAALGDLQAGSDVISVPQTGEEGEDGALRVPRSMLTRIIQARLTEIFEEVQKRLQASGYENVTGRRAVLTGGACQLTGTRELAARVLNKQVRIGRPQPFAGLAAASAGPDYATAIGLLMAGAMLPPEILNPELASIPAAGQSKSWLSRLTGRWLG